VLGILNVEAGKNCFSARALLYKYSVFPSKDEIIMVPFKLRSLNNFAKLDSSAFAIPTLKNTEIGIRTVLNLTRTTFITPYLCTTKLKRARFDARRFERYVRFSGIYLSCDQSLQSKQSIPCPGLNIQCDIFPGATGSDLDL
jgi:hypothetical protein